MGFSKKLLLRSQPQFYMTKHWPVRSAKPKQRLFSIECWLLFSMWPPTINKTSQWFSCYKQQIHSEIWMLHIQFLRVEPSSHSRSVSPCTVLTSGGFCLFFSQNTFLLFSPSNYCQFLPFLSDPVLSPCPCSVRPGLSSDSGLHQQHWKPCAYTAFVKEQTNGHVCVQTLK